MISPAELRTLSPEDAAYEALVIETELASVGFPAGLATGVLQGISDAHAQRISRGFVTRYDDPVEVDGLAGAVMGPNDHDEYARENFAMWASAFLQTTPELIQDVRLQIEAQQALDRSGA